MKIAFALDDSLDYPDGVQQYILTLGRWYHERGHDVHYIVSTTDRKDIPNVHVLAKNMSVTFNGNTVRTPRPVPRQRIRQLFRQQKFDVLHVQLPCSPLFVGRLLKYAPANVKRVGTFHIAPFGRLSAVLARVHAWTIRKSLRRLDDACSVSVTAQQFANRVFHLKSQVIPNAVDLSQFRTPVMRSEPDSAVRRIVFLGRLVERKGCIWLLRAVKQLTQDASFSTPIRVSIGGRGEQEDYLRRYVTNNNLDEVVHFDGFIEEDDKPAYLARADIAAFPSLGGESFGIILVEAMASSGPVVLAGDNPGYSAVLDGDKHHLFVPQDTVAFAALLRRYIEHPELRRDRVTWQSDLIAQYDVSRVGEQLLRLYGTDTA